MKKEDLRQIMCDAWRISKEYKVSISDGLKISWANFKLKNRLKNGVVSFEYKKKNGEIRKAIGTLKSELLPMTKGTGTAKSDKVQTYYDIEKQSFRCYTKAMLI